MFSVAFQNLMDSTSIPVLLYTLQSRSDFIDEMVTQTTRQKRSNFSAQSSLASTNEQNKNKYH